MRRSVVIKKRIAAVDKRKKSLRLRLKATRSCSKEKRKMEATSGTLTTMMKMKKKKAILSSATSPFLLMAVMRITLGMIANDQSIKKVMRLRLFIAQAMSIWTSARMRPYQKMTSKTTRLTISMATGTSLDQ